MSSIPAKRQMSVQAKINLSLVLIFALVLSVSLLHGASSEKDLVLQVVEQQTKDAADSYFDSLNTMMITGTMAQREVLRNKLLSRPGVLDARIVRGEPIKLVDGGTQKRAFTYIDDGIAALMKIIENRAGVASGRIYNIGNPANNFSVRELAQMMLKLAADYPEYRASASEVRLVDTTAADYYGDGYQDVQNRVPKIDNTCRDLDWSPRVGMDDALRRIFDAYRGHVADARALVE